MLYCVPYPLLGNKVPPLNVRLSSRSIVSGAAKALGKSTTWVLLQSTSLITRVAATGSRDPIESM